MHWGGDVNDRPRFVLFFSENLFGVADVHAAAINGAREKLRRRNEAGIQIQRSGGTRWEPKLRLEIDA